MERERGCSNFLVQGQRWGHLGCGMCWDSYDIGWEFLVT